MSLKYAICNEVYQDWSFERAFAHARQAGYTGIEIAPFTISNAISKVTAARRSEISQTAAKNDLSIVGLHWLLAGTSGFHLTSADSTQRQNTAAYLSELAQLCCDLGGDTMVFGSPNERNVENDSSREQAVENAVQVFELLLPKLESTNVTLALEPLGPEETNFMNTANSAVQIIEKLNSPMVRLHLDVKAMSTETESYSDIIKDNLGHFHHFHANDPNRQGPGMGDVKFAPILGTLIEVGYTGWISVEVFDYSPGIEKLVTGSIDYLRSVEAAIPIVFENGDDEI